MWLLLHILHGAREQMKSSLSPRLYIGVVGAITLSSVQVLLQCLLTCGLLSAGDLGNSSPSPRHFLVPRAPATAGSHLIHVISLSKPHSLSRVPVPAGAQLMHVVSRAKHIACLVPTYCLRDMAGFSGCFLWLIAWYGLVSDMTCF